MAWKFKDNVPVYLQLKDYIKDSILNGTYEADSQIPSVRQLAIEAAVNPNTVQRALLELENEGILVSRRTAGRFVTSDQSVLAGVKQGEVCRILNELISKAKNLGLTQGELIEYIKESEEWK